MSISSNSPGVRSPSYQEDTFSPLLPDKRSFCELPLNISSHSLFTGPLPMLRNFCFLKEIGTAVVLLDETAYNDLGVGQLYERLNIKVHRFPIDDYQVPSTPQIVHDLVLKMLSFLEKENILIHCLGGKGRTGLIVGCFIAEYLKIDGEEAVRSVREWIKGSIETPQQKKFVEIYASIYGKQPYTNNLKNLELDKEVPHIFCSDRMTIAERQSASENKKYEAQPTRSKTDSSSCLCIDQQEPETQSLLGSANPPPNSTQENSYDQSVDSSKKTQKRACCCLIS